MSIGKKRINVSALVIGIIGTAGSTGLSGCGFAVIPLGYPVVAPIVTPFNMFADATTTITGNVMFGPVNGAAIHVYPISVTTGDLDTSGQPLAKATTKADGTYSLVIPNSDIPSGTPIGVQMTDGSYTEEGSGATVSLTGQVFKSVLPSVTAGIPVVAAVNAFTDQAFQQFKASVAAGLPIGTTPAVAARNANYAMSQALGVVDIMVPPANTQGAIPNDASGQMATLLASLSALASSTSTSLGTTITSADVAKGMASALTASGGSFSKLGKSAVTITKPDGTTLTFTPPPLTGPGSLATTASGVAAGVIPMANYIPPATLTLPTLNPSPPMTAPASYVPGSITNVPPEPSSIPFPLYPNDPPPGSAEAIAAASPPVVVGIVAGSCEMAITPPAAGFSFPGLCADIYLTGSPTQLSSICTSLAQQQFPASIAGLASPTAFGTYNPGAVCEVPAGAVRGGTCTTGNLGMKIHYYSNGAFPVFWLSMVNTGAPAKCGTSAIPGGTIGIWAPGV